jgi:hypothetical protein
VKVKCFKDPVANLWEEFSQLESEIKIRSEYPYQMIEDHMGKDALDYNRENSTKFSHHIHLKIGRVEIYSTGKMKIKLVFYGYKLLSLKVPRAIIAWLSRRPAFRCALAQP